MATCTELEKSSLHHGSDEFVPNNLPYVRGPFVGRDSELQEISNMLLTGSTYADVAMVSIFGAPAVGKSTLAIQIGHVLARNGISVRYVNLNEAHHLFARHADVSDKPTNNILSSDDSTDLIFHKAKIIPWYSYTKKKYVLTSPKTLTTWAKELTNDTLLILDNCDDFLQRNKTHENNFKEMLTELLKASKHLRILTTSRAQMLIVDGFHPYPLKELDPSSAVTLLQLRSNLITSDEGKVIAELVGNNPLALGIVAELVNVKSHPPHAIIDELRKHLMQTLNQNTLSNRQRILTVLKISYNYLNDRIQLCSHYLSHFPGSFHRAAAQSILSNLSDPEYCLQTLIERSLLEEYWHTDQLRYQLHRLIGEFLQYVIQTEYSDAHAINIKADFNLNYQLYYSQDILSLSQTYSRSPNSNYISSRLERDMHNFKNILQKMAQQQLDIKSALNVAYSFTNSSDFVIEQITCDGCFVELLQALVIIFDQKLLEVSQEVGLNETTTLFFNLIFNVKKLWMISKVSTESCMAVCMLTSATHYSMVEKLSAAHRNALDAYYYLPLLCDFDCLVSRDFLFTQGIITLLVPVSIFTMIFVRVCHVKNRCVIIIVFMLFFIFLTVNLQLILILFHYFASLLIRGYLYLHIIPNYVPIQIYRYFIQFLISYLLVAMYVLSFFLVAVGLLLDLFFPIYTHERVFDLNLHLMFKETCNWLLPELSVGLGHYLY